jgi:hypothetical protein
MITGEVNPKLEAVIPLTVSGPQGQTRALEVVIDTGYSGFLTLPSAVIAGLDLTQIATGHLIWLMAAESFPPSALPPLFGMDRSAPLRWIPLNRKSWWEWLC